MFALVPSWGGAYESLKLIMRSVDNQDQDRSV